MPPQHQPDDEDTQEGPQLPDQPTAGRPGSSRVGAGAPPTGSVDWSSQRPTTPSAWQPPPEAAWQQAPRAAAQQPRAGGAWPQPQQGAAWPESHSGTWQQPALPRDWQQPAHGAWQQPPQWNAQQGWGAAGYWAPVPQYGSSALVVVGGVVLIIFGVLVTLIGFLGTMAGVMVGAVLEDVLPPGTNFDFSGLSTAIVVIMLVVLVVGILHIVSAAGIFMHKGWARVLGVIFGVLGTLLGVLMVAVALEARRPQSGDLAVPLIVLAGYALTLFALIAGGNHFTRRYPG